VILLTDGALRERFDGDVNGLVEAVPMTIFAAVIDKAGLRTRYADTRNPYRVALHFCMEWLHVMLRKGASTAGRSMSSSRAAAERRIGNSNWIFVGSPPTTAAWARAGRTSTR